MLNLSQIQCVRLYPLAIPLRRKFSHAAAERETADPIVVEVELRNGLLGYGETLARPYVTGETPETVLQDVPRLLRNAHTWRPNTFAEALEIADALPLHAETGRLTLAARAGLELALLDGYSRHFRRAVTEAAGWIGLPGFGSPGSIDRIRYSGVLSGTEPASLARSVRKMRWFGLRDFKLKVGYENDGARLAAVIRGLGRSLGDRLTLRLDANGGWTVDDALERLAEWSSLPIACVEQPLPVGQEQNVHLLRGVCPFPIMHDESLLTLDDAISMATDGLMDALNIRLSKNGGFLPSLRLAGLARQHDLLFQLGCLVGETSILSAAGSRFLECVPGVRFAEGSYGSFLLRGDVTRRQVRFGLGGRPKPRSGYGWGVQVDRDRLHRYLVGEIAEFRL